MEETIKVQFTKEEIDEFINNLQSSIGDVKKVKELLHVKSLPILIAYLEEIGTPENVLDKAGAVEAIRIRMIEILTDARYKNCVVSDTGIEYDYNYNKGFYRREKLGLDENNVFRLSKDKYFKNSEEYESIIYLMNDMENAFNPRIEIGEANCGRSIGHYMGVLGVKHERKMINGIPYVEIKEQLMDGSIEYRKVVDVGLPFFSDNHDSTFEENYKMYTLLFPNIKDWYDKYFIWDYRHNDNRTVKEKSDDIDRVVTLEKLYKIDLEIFGLQSNIIGGITNYRNNRKNIDEMIERLQEYTCEDDIEREYIATLIQRAQELADRETEFDDKEKMEHIKSELSVKDGVRKYGDLELDVLHQVLDDREDKKDRLSGIEEQITLINEEYQRLVDEVRRVLDSRNGFKRYASNAEEVDVRLRLEEARRKFDEKKEYYNYIVNKVCELIIDLSELKAINIVDDWCDKVEDLEEKHGLKELNGIDIERLCDDIPMNEEEKREYKVMLYNHFINGMDCAIFDFENWKKELERIKLVMSEVRLKEKEDKKIKLQEIDFVD